MSPAEAPAMAAEEVARLMPMHLLLDARGQILSAGPTLARLGGPTLVGGDFFALFEVRRPFRATAMPALRRAARGRLQIAPRLSEGLALRGHGAPAGDQGLLINLGFGMSLVDAVERYGLTAGDFAPTELAMEMLYLVEATSAAMAESRKLADRLRRAKRQAEARALTDPLTGLGNRRGLERALDHVTGLGEGFSVLQIDLDFFKQVNDMHGHGTGDRVLEVVADRLRQAIRRSDAIYRLGGDEFAVILRGQVSREELAIIAERVIRGIEAPVIVGEQSCEISASIGIAIRPAGSEAPGSALLEEADRALYRSKAEGRGRPTFA